MPIYDRKKILFEKFWQISLKTFLKSLKMTFCDFFKDLQSILHLFPSHKEVNFRPKELAALEILWLKKDFLNLPRDDKSLIYEMGMKLIAKSMKKNLCDFFKDLQSIIHFFPVHNNINFKPKQLAALETLWLKNDCFVNLPTGYGKSLVYQMGMKLIAKRLNIDKPICLVISPLNSLIDDQAMKLENQGLRVGLIALKDRKPGYREAAHQQEESESSSSDGSSTDEDKDCPPAPPLISNKQTVQSGDLDYLFSHPEAILSQQLGRPLLRKPVYQNNVVLIVIDEAHCVVEWAPNFRRDYGKLSALSALLNGVVKVAMTATAPANYKKVIIESLLLKNPIIITACPDRKNITYNIIYNSFTSTARQLEILTPIAEELKQRRLKYPQTVIYMSAMRFCGFAFHLFELILKNEQYEPINAEPEAKNRLFSQFHGAYPVDENSKTLNSVVNTEKCRVIFASTSFGMGIDARHIRNVIHIGVPRTVEEYFQETGRAGRDGEPSLATMYYNGHDVSTSRKDLKPEVKTLCKSDSCLRLFLIKHFGFKESDLESRHSPLHTCCSVCASECSCDYCKIMLVML